MRTTARCAVLAIALPIATALIASAHSERRRIRGTVTHSVEAKGAHLIALGDGTYKGGSLP